MTVRSTVEHEVKKSGPAAAAANAPVRKQNRQCFIAKRVCESGWFREKAALFAATIGPTTTSFQAHFPQGTILLVVRLNWTWLARDLPHLSGWQRRLRLPSPRIPCPWPIQ